MNDPLNEFIVVENQMNMTFSTLGQAINHGLKDVKNDLVVVVQEDILLLAGWQATLESSLSELEKHDPNWGVCSSVGWKDNSELVGHWSDPHIYKNTLETSPYCEAHRLDEKILIFRRSVNIEFDPNLPSIHNIGRDISSYAATKNLKTYVINAPTIHQYADQDGNLIDSVENSPKILNQRKRANQVGKQCSDEYFSKKWNLEKTVANADSYTADQLNIDSPIILLGRGGGGTRLLSTIAKDTGLFIGNKVNGSGDCIDMAPAIYRTVIRKYRCPDIAPKRLSIADLRQAAIEMRKSTNLDQKWGFKLPEMLLILPEIQAAFPKAQFINFKRDPIGTVLRKRSHLTARPDNEIGQIALKEAYQYFSHSIQQLLDDDYLSRMAITTMHQLFLTQKFRAEISQRRWLDISFEDTISDPEMQLNAFSKFCNLPILSKNIVSIISSPRAKTKLNEFSTEDIERVEKLISGIQMRSGDSD